MTAHQPGSVLALFDPRWEGQPVALTTDQGSGAAADPPLLLVKRTRADWTVRSVALTDDGGRPCLTVSPRYGPDLDEESLGAEEAASLLSAVSPGELTEFTLGRTAVTPHLLASRLVIAEPENLEADESWFNDPTEVLSDEQPDGVGSRLVVIDGVQWHAVEVLGREAKPLLIASEDVNPVEMDTWGLATYSETASMISGSDQWWMGRTWDPDVLVEVDKEDGGTPYVSCRYSPDAQKIPSIIGWLPTGHPGRWEPPEQVTPAGEPRAWAEFGAYCSGWDSAVREGSPTGEWNLWLDLGPDEIEEFNAAGRSSTASEHS